ncbi:MAG: hypothetical protein MHPSP_004312, partial [Paramarteilia canceri]
MFLILCLNLLSIIIESTSPPNTAKVNAFEVDKFGQISELSDHVCPYNYRMSTDGTKNCLLCDNNQVGTKLIVENKDDECRICLPNHIRNRQKSCVLCDNQAQTIRYNKLNKCIDPNCNMNEFFKYRTNECGSCSDLIAGSSSRYENSVPLAYFCKCDGSLVKIRSINRILCLNFIDQTNELEIIENVMKLTKYKQGFYYIRLYDGIFYYFANCNQADKRTEYFWPCLCDENYHYKDKKCIYNDQIKDVEVNNDEKKSMKNNENEINTEISCKKGYYKAIQDEECKS